MRMLCYSYLLATFHCPLTVHLIHLRSWKVELGVRPENCSDSLVVSIRRGIRKHMTVFFKQTRTIY